MGIIYSRYKIFHFNEYLKTLNYDTILPPIQIRIKPTNLCKHNCWYCAYRAENLQLGKDMNLKSFIPKNKMIEIINDIIDIGVRAVTFSGGGDPFHYPYLLDAIKLLSNSKVKFAALTHGALLKGEIAEIFAEYGTWIRISLDGWDEDSYSKYRGVNKGEFSKVLKNMNNFKRLNGKCYLGVSIVVDKYNSTHIFELIKLLKDIGVDSVKVSACIVSNDGKENNKYHKEIFNVVKNQIEKAISVLSDKNFEIFDGYHELDEKFNKNYNWCPYIQLCPVIGADLNVYACHDKAYNLTDGLLFSIKNKSFKEGWFKAKKTFFKINPSKVCNHHCVVNEKNKIILEFLDLDKEHIDFV